MKTENELPKRKRNRLEKFDYSSCGAYFITVCTKDRINLFWEKEQPDFVGEDIILPRDSIKTKETLGFVGEDIILPPDCRLSLYGQIVEEAIKAIPKYYAHIELLQYVVMPNHVHIILFIPYDCGRIISSPTTVITAVGQMKRHVSKKIGAPIWQRSFHDHVIRDRRDYEKISKYIYENPLKWQYDCFYTEE